MQRHQAPETDLPAPAAWVRDRREEAAELAMSLLSFDTQNPPGNTDEVVAWIDDVADDLGFERRTVASDPDKPNILVRIPGESDRTLQYNGHLDTVPFDRGRWSTDPLGERVGDRIYGRGAEDMKGPIAALLLTMEAFAATGATPDRTIEFAFVSDEETGGPAGTQTLLERGAVGADACVVTETTSTPDRHSVTVAERGRLWLTVEATGRAAHGSRPMLGVNAVDRLIDAVADVRSAIGGYELTPDAAVGDVIEESVAYYAPVMGEAAARRMFQYPTVNLGALSGGDSFNSVPAHAVGKLDVRLSPGVDPVDVLAVVSDILEAHEHAHIQEIESTSGTYEAEDSPIVGPAEEAMRRVTGGRVFRRCASGGSDARLFRKEGLPAVELGLGVGTAHGTDEYTTTETIVENATMYSLLPFLA